MLPSRPAAGVTLRGILLGLGFSLLYVLWEMNSAFRGAGGLYGAAILNAPIAALLLLVLCDRLLRCWRRGWALRPGEMLTAYCMVVMSCGLACHGIVGGGLPPVMTYPFYFANDQNRWQQLLWPHLPSWLTVQDPAVLEGFYAGETSPYARRALTAWAGPALWWASFIGAVMWVCLCLNSMVRRRWSDEERLPFPFVTVPVQLAEERFGLFRSKAWWIALVGSFTVSIWNAAAALVPSLPAVPMNFNFLPYIVHRFPWEAIGHRIQYLGWDPMYIGLCYLVPLDLLASLLVFELLLLVEYALSHYLGLAASIQGFPYLDQQTAGGLLALALAVLWLDRRYLAQVLRRALGLRSVLRDESSEAFGYRTAVLGAALGLAYLWWFWARAGVPGWALAAFFGLYFATVMVFSRIRAHVGSPTTDMAGVMPNSILRTVAGPLALGPATLGMLHLLNPYLIGYQENNPIPFQLEAMKMAESGRMERRRLALALAAMTPLMVICYFWVYLHFAYHMGLGAANTSGSEIASGRWGTELLDTLVRSPAGMDLGGTAAVGWGAAFTGILLAAKLRFHWWPLHPIAFPAANAWGMHYLTPVLVAIWLFKFLALRYGGLRAHRAALPVFLGLLVGDLAGSTMRTLVISLLGQGP